MHGICLQPAKEENEREEKLNISEYIADFSQLTNAYEATAQMSSEDILDVLRLLENVTPNELLRNATQRNRDLFTKVYRCKTGELLHYRKRTLTFHDQGSPLYCLGEQGKGAAQKAITRFLILQ